MAGSEHPADDETSSDASDAADPTVAGVDGTDVAADDADAASDFASLTLKERLALATAQQPTVALAVLLLFLFAFTFLIALVLVFPRVAGLFVGGGVLLAAVVAGMLVVFRRFGVV